MSLLEYIGKKQRTCVLPFMGTNALKILGYTIDEVYNSPKKQLEIAKKMDKLLDADFIYPMDDGNIFCETLNIPLIKPDYDFSIVKENPITDIETLSKYKVPDPYKDGRMPINLESLKLISQNFDKPLFVSIQGPFTLAVLLGGAVHVSKSIIKNPEYVNKLLEFTTKVVLTYAKALEKVGVQYISFAEPFSVLVSPKRFEKLVANNLKYLYENLNCWKGLHICGDTTRLLDQLFTCGAEGISLDQIMDLPKIAPIVPKDIVLIGNLDPIDVLHRMKPEEIEKETTNLIKAMKPYKNFLLAFGCTCLNDTPIENLQAVTKTVRDGSLFL